MFAHLKRDTHIWGDIVKLMSLLIHIDLGIKSGQVLIGDTLIGIERKQLIYQNLLEKKFHFIHIFIHLFTGFQKLSTGCEDGFKYRYDFATAQSSLRQRLNIHPAM